MGKRIFERKVRSAGYNIVNCKRSGKVLVAKIGNEIEKKEERKERIS